MTHLDAFKNQNMNADQIKKASSYDTATPEKKAIIDSYTNAMNVPMDEKSMVSTIIA
jgi:hypothetical protein